MVKDMFTFDVGFMEDVPVFFFNFFIALLYALIIIFENKFQNIDSIKKSVSVSFNIILLVIELELLLI